MTRDIRLVPIALAIWAMMFVGIAHSVVSLNTLKFAGLAVLFVWLLALVIQWRVGNDGQRSVRSLQVVLLVVAMLLLAAWRVTALNTEIHASGIVDAAENKRFATVVGRVSSEPKEVSGTRAKGTISFALSAVEVEANGSKHAVPAQVRVMLPGGDLGSATFGSTVRVEGKLSSAKPGERSVALMNATAAPVLVRPPGLLSQETNLFRANLVLLVSDMSEQARGLVPGAAIGDTRELSDDLSEAMKVTGLTHITAVSGSHFSIILVLLSALAWRIPKVPRALVLAAACLAFVALVHPSGAVLRALVMGLAALYSVSLGRRSQGIAALSWAVIALLLIDPFAARDYGFVLSVCATAGLIVGAGPIMRFLHRPTGRDPFLPKVVAGALSIPIAAQLAVGPVLILLQPYVSVYSVPANIVAAPALFPATILGLAATVAAPFNTNLAHVAAVGASGATWWIAATAQVFAGLPGAKIPWLAGPSGAVALGVVSAVTICGCIAVRKYGNAFNTALRSGVNVLTKAVLAKHVHGESTERSVAAGWQTSWRVRAENSFQVRVLVKDRAWHRLVAIITLGAVAACLVFLLRPVWLRSSVMPGAMGDDWQVAACDVGQGDGFLARAAGGELLMFDVGQEAGLLRECLGDLAVEHIDVLILTHFHADHVGALETLLKNVKVDKILTGPVISVGATERAVFDTAERHGVPIAAAGSAQGTALFGVNGALPQGAGKPLTQGNWETVWPTREEARMRGVEQASGADSTNNLSLAVRVELAGGGSALFLGDLEQDGQEHLADFLERTSNGGDQEAVTGLSFGATADPVAPRSVDGELAVDLVKMAHHGSASQSERLAWGLSPEIVLVGVGKDNDYGHPTRSALSLYEDVGATVLTTEQCGTFAVHKSSERWFVVGGCP